ncbi:integrase, catalytic region, zinc finger, CCHC-type containing protein, partial [Tanacetum coccineum]
MLEKSMYDSWESRIRLFIKGTKHGRMMLDSIANGPLVYPTIKENGQARPMKYSKLTKAQQLQDNCDVQATNIFFTVFHPIKFVTDVKLAKSLYATNYDQLYAYLSHHVHITRERYPDPLAMVANSPTLYNPSQSTQHSISLMYPPPQQSTPIYAAPIHHQHYHTPQGEDPIECINKAMAFLSAIASRVTVQQVQGRQTHSYASTGNRGIATTSKGNFAAGQLRVVKCYNCQGEGHMARQSEAHEAGQILNEEQLAFLADPGIDEAPVALKTIPQTVLMANLSSCNFDVLSKVPYSDTYPNDMINQDVQEM